MQKYILVVVVSMMFWNCSSQENSSSITTKDLEVLILKKELQLLDVRTPKEIEQGYIKGAKFSNYFESDFTAQVTKKFDSEKTIYVYCRSGNRSLKAVKILTSKGFKAINVLGGYDAWKSAQ